MTCTWAQTDGIIGLDDNLQFPPLLQINGRKTAWLRLIARDAQIWVDGMT